MPTNHTPMSLTQRFATYYVCWCDGLSNCAWHRWCRLYGAYRLFRWAEWRQHCR